MNKLLIILLLLGLSTTGRSQSNQALRDSLAHANDVLEYHPDSIDLRLKKISWNLQLEEWQRAKEDLDVVLVLDKNNVAGLFYRAYANERLNRFNFARLDYQNLLTVVPGDYNARLGLALLNQKDKHFTEAMDQINALVEQFPDSASAYAARAGIEKERGMNDLAEYDFAKAVEHDPSNVDYRINHLDLLLTLNRKMDARDEYQQLVALGVAPAALRKFSKRLKALK